MSFIGYVVSWYTAPSVDLSTDKCEQERWRLRAAARMSVIATEPVLESAESAAKNPGYCDTPHEDTKGYFIQQTVSTTEHLDAELLRKILTYLVDSK